MYIFFQTKLSFKG